MGIVRAPLNNTNIAQRFPLSNRGAEEDADRVTTPQESR